MERCSAGSERDVSGNCKPCPAGTTDHDANSATACIQCLPGTFAPEGNQGICEPCPPGNYGPYLLFFPNP
eukprot:m.28211 g.28211  ORF g.28211 m.28211 type:complete len:70 (-) comp10414_c0_seq1:166-375(-)